ncbi:alkyl sulfatase C-terminal domain-containing protein [Streptomyces sp. NPDC048272]|uniref:alkyl sulfatase C-terminal domain-containing protein n=1 Tax=Streptomyces sp. NPDC048272 TaxID=3154616 RepID=UPI0034148371
MTEGTYTGGAMTRRAVYMYGAEPAKGPARQLGMGLGMTTSTVRGTVAHTALETTNPEMSMALTVDTLVDSLAIRVDGPRAWDEKLGMDWTVTDEGRTRHLLLSNGALTHRSTDAASETNEQTPAADLTLTLTKPQLLPSGGWARHLRSYGIQAPELGTGFLVSPRRSRP